MASLSIVLATYNEEKNLTDCLASIKDIAQEIIIVDGTSSDRTVEIAQSFGAVVIVTDNPPIFHINKQKAIDQATKDWIIQLDADERVSKELAEEIVRLINMSDQEIMSYQLTLPKRTLFLRHQKLLEQRDGAIGTADGPFVAFFFPRRNYFLGRYLMHGGVYPDGVIRMFKKGQAYLPAKDVHEQMVVAGRVGWLENDLIHMDSPTFEKYLMRWKRYTTLIAADLDKQHVGKNIFIIGKYMVYLPMQWFIWTFFRHKGFLDFWPGFVFSLFSALRFPVSYWHYLTLKQN